LSGDIVGAGEDGRLRPPAARRRRRAKRAALDVVEKMLTGGALGGVSCPGGCLHRYVKKGERFDAYHEIDELEPQVPREWFARYDGARRRRGRPVAV
jgi:hypothetical protein